MAPPSLAGAASLAALRSGGTGAAEAAEALEAEPEAALAFAYDLSAWAALQLSHWLSEAEAANGGGARGASGNGLFSAASTEGLNGANDGGATATIAKTFELASDAQASDDFPPLTSCSASAAALTSCSAAARPAEAAGGREGGRGAAQPEGRSSVWVVVPQVWFFFPDM